ncbi:gamma-glutamyl-gamma-aminobutyrate hydrolase family protein [Undibacterium curvum]|jgi:putative glutamine amidotransferase|uniref:Gamma-glutamyl-gamma-aminobutyrate hydrolase family protein n=1 Tax=Undibacterium curvum TaxID=2762294 RepID=A0ABR7A0M6_9BURK|nr:gamma-glutamyl-gamma-aminobutyrate hydrolase family protein [Undibacterium curvum]MBC3930382.1 gamma-glutamyl-gamma-aminobutyrate hydrolase family protein [Undibacterium curvum]
MHKPIVIVPACTAQIGAHAFHVAQAKYLEAVQFGADCLPLILPAFGTATDLDSVLASADGIMLTGAYSNVHPSHYEQSVINPSLPQDLARDATTLPLIRAAHERGLPFFAICRGFQEVNVALGGSLYQAVQQVDGKFDHREDKTRPQEQQYAPAHLVRLSANGELAQILDGASELMVNSLHGQGIDRLAAGLRIEARADDGLIEAYSFGKEAGFAMAVQWHPEWNLVNNPESLKLFRAFGRACRDYQTKRGRQP